MIEIYIDRTGNFGGGGYKITVDKSGCENIQIITYEKEDAMDALFEVLGQVRDVNEP